MTDLLNDLVDEDEDMCESVFNSATEPAISIPDFLRRLHKYTHFSNECLVIAVIYIDRYNLSDPTFSLNRLNIHKLILAAVLLAAKYQDDFYYDNKAFEFAGGVNALHLHQLELELFKKLHYNLYVSEEDYHELKSKLYEVYGNSSDNWNKQLLKFSLSDDPHLCIFIEKYIFYWAFYYHF